MTSPLRTKDSRESLFDSHVPAFECCCCCCDDGSATLATLEHSSFSLERGHSSPPWASNRLSLENSAGGRAEDKRRARELVNGLYVISVKHTRPSKELCTHKHTSSKNAHGCCDFWSNLWFGILAGEYSWKYGTGTNYFLQGFEYWLVIIALLLQMFTARSGTYLMLVFPNGLAKPIIDFKPRRKNADDVAHLSSHASQNIHFFVLFWGDRYHLGLELICSNAVCPVLISKIVFTDILLGLKVISTSSNNFSFSFLAPTLTEIISEVRRLTLVHCTLLN